MTARIRLPARRLSVTISPTLTSPTLGRATAQITLGHDSAGALREVWVDVHKEGAILRGLLSTLGRLASLALQHGASAAEVAHSLRHEAGSPGDVVGHETIRDATSLPDLVAQVIEADGAAS